MQLSENTINALLRSGDLRRALVAGSHHRHRRCHLIVSCVYEAYVAHPLRQDPWLTETQVRHKAFGSVEDRTGFDLPR